MKKLAVSLIAALAFAAGAHAADRPAETAPSQATVSAAGKLVTVMKLREIQAQAMLSSLKMAEQGLMPTLEMIVNSESRLTAEQKAKALARAKTRLPELNLRLRKFYADQALLDDFEASMIRIYARYYTQNEIEQLAGFYRTPLGQKVLASTAQIAGEGMTAFQQLMMQRYQAMLQEMVASLFKE